jgi:6-pyruvoyltetrahydropterin/6-carboxytetrahydropterin synthase
MFYAEVEDEIDAGHFLKLPYPSKCNGQHGHRWRIKVFILAEQINEFGMIVDFTAIKEIVNKFDHQNLNKMDEFKDLQPTAENFARILAFYTQEKLDLEMNRPVCWAVEIWETPNNKVRWEMQQEETAGEKSNP